MQPAQTEQAALRIGQQLIEEEQRSQARAATKKAKKQRQKDKRDSDSTSAAVQQQQLSTAQTEEESEQARHMDDQLPKHTQRAQQAQHAQHALQHMAPQPAQQAQHAVLQGHDHRQPCTTECAPMLSDSVTSSSSQASSLIQKHEMATTANGARVDTDAVFVQQLFCCPITKVRLLFLLTMSCWHVVNDSRWCVCVCVSGCDVVMIIILTFWHLNWSKQHCLDVGDQVLASHCVPFVRCTQPGCLSICVRCDS